MKGQALDHRENAHRSTRTENHRRKVKDCERCILEKETRILNEHIKKNPNSLIIQDILQSQWVTFSYLLSTAWMCPPQIYILRSFLTPSVMVLEGGAFERGWGHVDGAPVDEISVLIKEIQRNSLGGPVVKNPPSNAEDMGSISGWGTTFPHASDQPSPGAITTEPLLLLSHISRVRLCATP